MMEPPKSAFVLTAGLGLRMRPLTDDRPKPLVEVRGRPLIDHVLDRIADAGIQRAVLNLHYKGDMLRRHLDGRDAPEIVFSDESEALLDTGGGTKKALPLLGDGPFLTHNCDSLWIEGMGSNLERLIAGFDEDRMDALLLLAPLVNAIGFDGRGDFDMSPEGHITRREEMRMAPYAWTGVQIVSPRLFEDAPAGAFSTNLLFDAAIERERLYGIRLDGTWMHVGTPAAIGEVEGALARA